MGNDLVVTAFEAEQEGEVAAPLEGGFFVAGVDLDQGGVKRAAASGAGSERLGAFAVEQEWFAGERGCAFDV